MAIKKKTRKSDRAKMGKGQSQSQGEYPNQSASPNEESETAGEILGAGQGGPSRSSDARHNEGLAGSEGLGDDDKVIDSSFSLSGRKLRNRDEEEDIDVDIGPQSAQGRGSGIEGHGRGMDAPGAGA